MFKGEDDFIKGLKSNPDQTAIIDELFKNPDFQKIWQYLKNCRAVTIDLKISPNLKNAKAVPRFGQYTPLTKTLELNPAHPTHAANASELADTLIHELIHALWDVREDCGGELWPLPPGVVDWYHDPDAPDRDHRPDKASPEGPNKKHAEKHYGDGASDPDHEFLDENDKAQEFIVRIINKLLEKTAGDGPDYPLKGGPTLTHENLKKLQGVHRVTKNWQRIKSITWYPDNCWRRTSTPKGWIMRCTCAYARMIVKYENGSVQIDLIGKGDSAELNGDSLDIARLTGWETP